MSVRIIGIDLDVDAAHKAIVLDQASNKFVSRPMKFRANQLFFQPIVAVLFAWIYLYQKRSLRRSNLIPTSVIASALCEAISSFLLLDSVANVNSDLAR